MKYAGMPWSVWLVFGSSFRKHLCTCFGLTAQQARDVAQRAHRKYREIIAELPEFEKEDRFSLNIIHCAMLCAFILCMPQRPDVETLTTYYAEATMTPLMKWFCRQSGKTKFTTKDMENMRRTEALRAGDRNPYSWTMELLPYADGSGYEARFTCCGICALTKKLGLYDLTPALCHLDYTMGEAGGAAQFVRQYTLATGGPYCDCGYVKKSASSQ